MKRRAFISGLTSMLFIPGAQPLSWVGFIERQYQLKQVRLFVAGEPLGAGMLVVMSPDGRVRHAKLQD